MNDDFESDPGSPNDEMAIYLQMYLDETSEQLDGLVDTLLYLEGDPTNHASLNEAFRLIHSIKGSSAMMGLDSVAVLTHYLENHFERLRSGMRTLDQPMMDLILRCIDFLRSCNQRLRAGETLASAPELLEELANLHNAPAAAPPEPSAARTAVASAPAPVAPPPEPEIVPVIGVAESEPSTTISLEWYRVAIRFAAELPLPELKAEIVLTRLSALAHVASSSPPRSELERLQAQRTLELIVQSERSPDELRAATNIGGVELVEIEMHSASVSPAATHDAHSTPAAIEVPETTANVAVASPSVVAAEPIETPSVSRAQVTTPVTAERSEASAEPAESKAKVGETVRVDIDRLDNLMNLVGELVVNKARFTQLAREMSPAFKKASLSGKARAFGDMMRRVMTLLRSRSQETPSEEEGEASWGEHLLQMEAEIESLDEQTKQWDETRRSFSQVVEAIDQLSRVSENLQRGVLDTRMVPIAPLFNRFKRVVRDISHELNKRIVLDIHGENTELDKRMIDELGDPLVHLIRNSIDHGIESAEVRRKRGKPETGTVTLEASHSGNNVFVTVRDDGGGINLEKVRQRIVSRGFLTDSEASALSERETLEYIWAPGFSTADVVSDISGRGVGMDIVKTRIAELNGVIDIDHTAGQGTCFTIRLPLTLAIIRSLLFKLRHGVFAVPIDNVREIVNIALREVVDIQGKKTFDVRGEFIPLVDIEDIFFWHDAAFVSRPRDEQRSERDAGGAGDRMNVVILESAGKTLGLRVDELQGGQDIVIKSLAENFVHIRGLSGASILGDGSVCLLIDVGAVIEMAIDPKRKNKGAERTALSA